MYQPNVKTSVLPDCMRDSPYIRQKKKLEGSSNRLFSFYITDGVCAKEETTTEKEFDEDT